MINDFNMIIDNENVMMNVDRDIAESAFSVSMCANIHLAKQIKLKNCIKDCIKNINISEYPAEWERNISQLISRRDRQEHPVFINSLLSEVKEMYVETMKNFTLKSILYCKETHRGKDFVCEERGILIDSKHIIETSALFDNAIFRERRSLFAKRYFLCYPIIGYVMNAAHHILPAVICNFQHYHKRGILTLYDFQDMILGDIKTSSLKISNHFYTGTFKALQKSKTLRIISARRLSRLMRCLTNIFVQQILDMMTRSIDHMISIMRDGRFCPRIKFQLLYENNQLVTKPDIDEVFSTYHNIIGNIGSIAQDLIPLGEWLNIKTKKRYIDITLPNWFIDESHRNLQEILSALFQPMSQHVMSISAEFSDVCSSSKNQILSLISKIPNFDAYLTYIRKYDEYLNKANAMSSNLYYNVGQLEQSHAKATLKQICREIMNDLTVQLVEQHRDFNRSICSDFEDIKSTALDIPKNAIALIQLGEYMSRVSNVLIKEQEQKIYRSIYMLSMLLEITTLSDEHVDLNRTTINWLHDIQPVFAQNNTLCEAMKSELEEDLQRRINTLNSEVNMVFPRLVILDNMNDINRVREYMEHYESLIDEYKCIENKMDAINSEERLFKFPETEFPNIIELKETIMPFYKLIRTIYQWQRNSSAWLNGPFECLNAAVIERKTLKFFNEITEMNRTMKSRIKMDVTANKSYKFSGIADDPDPMQQPAPLNLCWQALDNVNEFKVYLPLAACMCNPALSARHWKEMSAIYDFDLTPNAGTTLKKMIDMNLMDNIEQYEIISSRASKELRLQRELAGMIEEWEPISFGMSTDTESGMVTFKYANEIEILLGEHLIRLDEMKASHFVKPILPDVTDLFVILEEIQEILDQWRLVQSRKLRLKAIFSYPRIEMRLQRETSLYLEAMKILMDINEKFMENPSFRSIQKSSDLLRINEANEKLEEVIKGVKDYVNTKRLSFTRFFFLEDSEIQQILFESIDMTKRHAFAKKCFIGIEGLKFHQTASSDCIQGIIGNCGEILHLNSNTSISVDTECEEQWLIQLEREMKNVIRERILQYRPFIDENLTCVSLNDFPSMVIVCGLQLYWTSSVERCLMPPNTAALNSLLVTYTDRIIWTTNELKNNITRRCRSLLMSSIIILLGHKEIISLLLKKNIAERRDFEWIAQLKYYCNDKIVEISVFNATIKYGYEYNFYQQNIINTPLTDRCFRTILQAYRYHLYSNIVGPTDTGKTETIRNLTMALAKPFYVINCGDDISYDCIIRTLKGVISCGAWICFENFTRLKLELLSAIAQNLMQMMQAVSSDLKTVNFEGYILNLDVSGYICANINLERLKHTNLPDNLKVLFRSVSMVTPDINRIAEVELFAGGFLNAKDLATKLVVSYKLLTDHLGEKKYHYNLGMSSLKSVVTAAISMKRNVPDENEYILLLRSMIDINIPQLCNADILLFQNIMRDVFAEFDMPPFNCSTILNALEEVCTKRFLTLHSVLKLKVIQIIELTYIRRGLILIGDPLSGKTEILHTLAEVLLLLHNQEDKLGAIVKLETIMPGIVDNQALFGYFCDESGIWKDGLCTSIFRRFAKNGTDHNWLVFDGDLDGTWIENLYTVIDENKMLYLASGERLSTTKSTSIFFETMNVPEISPGIISRCGIIYIDSSPVGWKPYVLSHIAKHDIYNGYDKVLRDLFDWVMNPCLIFLREDDAAPKIQELHLVFATLNLFETLITDAYEDTKDEGRDNHFIIWAQATLLLAVAWGLGGNLIEDSQIRFNTFCISLWNNANVKYLKPDTIKHFEVALPNEGLIQDNWYIFKGIGSWKYWGDVLKSEKIPEYDNFNQIYVPSISSIKYNHVFLKHIKHRQPFLLYGDIAVGKSCIMHSLLSNKLPENCLSNFFSFTSMNVVSRTQKLLLSKLNKVRRTNYGPGRNQFCVNFVDDMDRATIQRSGAQSVFELFRQLLSYNYCYDASELSKIFIQDVTFAFSVTAGKINGSIPPRLLRHFNTYAIPSPTADNIFRIYSNILLTNFKKNLFAMDITGSVTNIVKATIDIYQSIKKTLRPVPGKLYYTFNMRDISKVINGCGLIQKESVEMKVTFVRLWAHEVLRVFGDRIVDEDDKEWLFLKIRNAIKDNFIKDSFDVAFDHLPKSKDNQITKDSFRDLIFGSFMDTEKSGKYNSIKRYEEIGSIEALKNKVLIYLTEYNASFAKKIDLIVCRYMLESLIKISRILSISGGNMLLISTAGSGKRSLTKLAAFMQQQSFFEATIESYYDMDIWRNDLRRVLRECGTLRKDITYFMSERQMKDAFLRDISCLLSTGELPDLFSAEDKQVIIERTRLHAQGGDQNAELSGRSIMTYFVNQCRNRLHFVLCFSPINIAYRTYLCSYPNLAKHCTVNCCQVWPDQMFSEIAAKHTGCINVQEEIRSHLKKACVQFHNSAVEMSVSHCEMIGRTIHVTSSAFLHMLKLYTRLMLKKQEEIIATRNRYVAGLEKLELAAEQVEQMKNTLMSLKPQLELSAQQTVITMKEVENENVTVEQATIIVKRDEEIANEKAEIAGVLRLECEAELAVAIPILEDAVAALNTLKPTDITLVKAMKNPPDTIKLVMAAVCVMLGVPANRNIDLVTGKKFTDYWGPSKRILSDMNFLQNLKDYDKDNIAPEVMQVIKKTYMTDNSFMPHIVAKASSAAEGLCKWVRAMVSYDEVAKVVAPKKKKLAAAQRECDEVEAFLNEKRQTLAALNAKLAALNDNLRQTLQKKLNLETEVATCTAKLVKAERLIANLGGEKDRWMQCVHKLQMNYDYLAGDMLLSCGMIAYMASYNISYREEILIKWKEFLKTLQIPYTKAFSFISVLGVEIQINHWQLYGLSKNRFATENAIILNNSDQWCMFIDSQNQMNQWIRSIEKKNNLKIIKPTDPNYMTIIEQSIENGVPVLLEDVGKTLDIALEPILLKRIYKEHETWYIDMGSRSVKYSQDFRFYITTRLINPNYAIDIFSKLTIMDFSMPNGNLRDKLLDIVISKEKPELQERFEVFRIQDAANKKVLRQQEDNILSILSSTSTNILEDENAIQILDSSKILTIEIMKKQKAARTMTKNICEFRDAYLQLADYCAGLFCTLNTLSNLNHMYRFSFSWFIQLYITSIETSNRSIVRKRRLRFLKSSFTRSLHSSVCRSLFEKHKLLYSFLLCTKILIDTGQTTREEVKYFSTLKNEENHDAILASISGIPKWLSMDKWRQICKLSDTIPNLHGLADDFRNNSAAWEKYCNATPFRSDLIPTPWINVLTRFQRLMLVKVIRHDKIIVEIMRLVEDTMEYRFNANPFLQISESYAESNCLTPIMFILPSCVSPLSLVSMYASARGHMSKFMFLSMGEKRQDNIEVLIEQTRKEGGWILLQNCHRVISWLSRLERICESLKLADTSLDFRLWLSSSSVPDFPIGILQNSVKIAYDHPLQLKRGLLESYRLEPIRSKEFFEGCPGKDKEFSKLLYGLCFFHELVGARRYFGAQGWNVPYNFDHADLEISIKQLQYFVNELEDVPRFDILLYLIGECNYGGKISDSLDQRCLRHLLDAFCNARVISDNGYSFFRHKAYSVPQRCEYRDIIMHIDNMQLDASPEVFACDENALIIKDTTLTREFLESISLLDQVRVPNCEVVQSSQVLQAIDEIDKKLPTLLDINGMQEKHSLVSREPLNAILIHEAESFNEILAVIMESLDDLRSALNGEILLIDSLEDLSKKIHNNTVPRVWRTIGSGIVTENLSNYISLLLKRADLLQNWHDTGLPPRVIHFDALSCCKSFLSATLLTFSRRHDVPIEQITLDLKVTRDSTYGEDADTYYIHGLHLAGARWDTRKHMLVESLMNVFWHDMPPIRFTFSRGEKEIDNIYYECPLYTSPIRYNKIDSNMHANKGRNYITNVPLETDRLHVYWIERGTALFCQVDK